MVSDHALNSGLKLSDAQADYSALSSHMTTTCTPASHAAVKLACVSDRRVRRWQTKWAIFIVSISGHLHFCIRLQASASFLILWCS